MSDLRFLIENFESSYSSARSAESAGELAEARRHYLEAAQFLLQAAQSTPEGDPLREKRKKNAMSLLEKARRLKSAPEKSSQTALARDGDDDEKQSDFHALKTPSITFEDIAGLGEVKEQIRLRMVYPFLNRSLAGIYGIQKGGGVLLYGPPGTGKTLLARAVAGEIKAPFFTVKPSEIMSKFVGEAEKNVQNLFSTARSHPLSIVFIDEVEALLPRRAESQSSVMTRLVPQILAELEGVDAEGKNPLLFVGATNEPWSLDPAVLRPGRFDVKIYVGLPDRPARCKLLEIHLKLRPLAADVDIDELADALDGFSGADIRNICQTAAQNTFLEAVRTGETVPIRMDDLRKARGKPSVTPDQLERFLEYRDGP